MPVDEASVLWVAAVCVAAAIWVVSVRRRRAVVQRVVAAAARLETAPPSLESPGLASALHRLDRAVSTTGREAEESGLAKRRFSCVLNQLPQGVVFSDEAGESVVRNTATEAFPSARHGEALVEAAVEELLRSALEKQSEERTVELFGPPRRTLELSAVPLADELGPVGGLVVVEDVSERRRLEEIRRDFVANLSHELKTPVGAIGLLAETLRAESDPEVTRRLSERVFMEAHRVGRIIDDLLELSRIEVEEAPVRETVPVHEVVVEAVDRIRPVADQRNIAINAAEPPLWLTIPGDRRQLVSAVANLLDNAVKYSDPDSDVGLRVSTASNRSVRIDVEDRGIGIPIHDLERVFERFYRVDRGRSRSTGGTGLGLAIVRHVASNHHGEVAVRSQEGAGSLFTLVLPADQDVVQPTVVETPPAGIADSGVGRR